MLNKKILRRPCGVAGDFSIKILTYFTQFVNSDIGVIFATPLVNNSSILSMVKV